MNLASLSDKSSRSLGALGFGLNKKHYFPWASCRGSAVDRVHESLRDGDFDKCVEFREAMKSVGGSQFYYDDLNSAYERYKADYKRAFGKEPISVSVQRI